MRFFGLIGKTLEHSFSPIYFKEKFDQEGITDCFYNLYPLRSIDEFSELINDFTELSGLNVTIPYKKDIISFLDELDEHAQNIGAVNTIKLERISGKLKLIGYNTDYMGFIESLKPLIKKNHKSAIILGTGGSSLAVKYGLKQLGIKYIQVSREPENKDVLTYNGLTRQIISENKIIINTTPLGMYPDISHYPDIPFDSLSNQHLLYDLIYNPKQTEFLRRGSLLGANIKNGFDMLVKQADFSWKIWNDLPF